MSDPFATSLPTPHVPLSPDTSVKRLGVQEELVTAPAEEHLVWDHIQQRESALALCLTDDLERDPTLVGAASFSIRIDERGTRIAIDPESNARALPSVQCVASELAKIGASARPLVAVYRLVLTGGYKPMSKRPTVTTDILTDALDDPSGLTGKVSGAVGRCVREGDAPAWLVGRLVAGKLELVRGPRAATAGERCIERALSRSELPALKEPIALSAFIALPKDKRAEVAPEDDDPSRARGNMWGDEIGDAFGAGGSGLRGIGEGGGGRGEGIGLGEIGTLGHGAGAGKSRPRSAHISKRPFVRMGAISVSGRLPPEVIQRIVRQNFGRFRLCYENGLRTNPSLAGLVTVTFTIKADGSVEKASATTDMKSKGVSDCIAKSFFGLSFPQPERGVVKVVYPIGLSPGDGAPADTEPASTATPKPAPPKAFTVGKKSVRDLTTDDLVTALKRHGSEPRLVGGGMAGSSDPMVVFVRRPSGQTVLLHRMTDGSEEAKAALAGSEAARKSGGFVLFAKSSSKPAAEAMLRELAD